MTPTNFRCGMCPFGFKPHQHIPFPRSQWSTHVTHFGPINCGEALSRDPWGRNFLKFQKACTTRLSLFLLDVNKKVSSPRSHFPTTGWNLRMKKTLKKAVFGINVSLLDQASPEIHMTSEILSYVKPYKEREIFRTKDNDTCQRKRIQTTQSLNLTGLTLSNYI